MGGAGESVSSSEAAERACRKFGERLALLVSRVGAEALLSRALHVVRTDVRTDFLLFDEQRTARTVEALTQRLRESPTGVQPSPIRDESAAVLTTLIALVVSFIGEDLATRLLRDVWPELPMPEPTSQSSNGHVEANL